MRDRPEPIQHVEIEGEQPKMQTFLNLNGKFGLTRDPDGQDTRGVTLRSYKDKRAAKNRVARKQRKTNNKRK